MADLVGTKDIGWWACQEKVGTVIYNKKQPPNASRRSPSFPACPPFLVQWFSLEKVSQVAYLPSPSHEKFLSNPHAIRMPHSVSDTSSPSISCRPAPLCFPIGEAFTPLVTYHSNSSCMSLPLQCLLCFFSPLEISKTPFKV